MFCRTFLPTLMAALALAAGAGCRKSDSGPGAAPGASAAETIARVHWLGKNRLAADTNAASFMEIWNLPESGRLEAQTLDKLALAPWRLLRGDAATNGAPSARLRPLLDDLVREESYLEIRAATNGPGELALALRLGPARGGLWETNLAAVLESLTGIQPVAATGRPGWALTQTNAPQRIELTRVGDWTLIGLVVEGRNGGAARPGPAQNALLADGRARIERDGAPFAVRATNFWLEAALDLRRVSRALALDWRLPEGWPAISATVISDGSTVVTRGRLDFARPPAIPLETWNIPTQLISDPLVSFTAVRGLRPWLESLPVWRNLQLGPAPNQLFFWALEGMPLRGYVAAPLPDAGNTMETVTKFLLQKVNPWMTTNAMGRFEAAPAGRGVLWTDAPIMAPFLQAVVTNNNPLILGGWFPHGVTTNPPPPGLIHAVLGPTNLLAYDWELTGRRVDHWLFTGQLLRMVLHRAQLPFKSPGHECASIAWFKAIAPRLGNCATAVHLTGPDQISFVRRSTLGFGAVELHALADWLESPQFPRGWHTLLAPPPPPEPAPKS